MNGSDRVFEFRVIDTRLQAAGASRMRSIELATMARAVDSPGGRARMVELRAVEAGFPYYGQLTLEGGTMSVFTDGAYANWQNTGDTSSDFGLLSWNQYNADCYLTFVR